MADYLKLTKPRIVALLLITTVPSMILARRGLPSLGLIAATLLGGTLAAGGSNAVNQYMERDIDKIMARTRRRPVPSGRIPPRNALAFGLGLGLVGVGWLALLVNLLSALLAGSAFLFYVLVYTQWLKRRSPLNIVIGGAAGGVPVLVGWASVTGRVGLPAVVLFAIVLFWTPPHFWSLAMRYQRDYAAAGIPMLPVVATRQRTARQIVGYSIVTVAASLTLYSVAHMGAVYAGIALVAGGWFVRRAVQLERNLQPRAATALFTASIHYLTLLFLGVGIDSLLRFNI